MTVFSMQNQEVSVSITEHASEITSFKDRNTGFEYMWQGDPAFWSGRNPTLFPMVGSTWNKEIVIHDHVYTMGNHGFARHSDFTCTEHSDSRIVMTLKDNEETLKQYPFHFTMHIAYELAGRKLRISYTIANDNDESMPFNFGLHPAFSCPIDPEKRFSDYHLEYSEPETFKSGVLEMNNEKIIPLNRDLLQKTIIEENPVSKHVSLTDGSHSVTVGIEGYRWLAFWTKPEAPFICIEPWHSHGDTEKTEVPFEKREGTIVLNAHEIYTTAYSIEIR